MKSLVSRILVAVAVCSCLAVSAFAGANNGPIRHTDEVFSTDTYRIVFNGDELAEIGVVGDGSTILSLYVYDENGHLIVSDVDRDDDKLVQWTPSWTGTFTVKVVNRGSVENDYVFLTN